MFSFKKDSGYSSIDISNNINKRHDGVKNIILKNQDILGDVEIVEEGKRKVIYLSEKQFIRLLFLFRNNPEIWKYRDKIIGKLYLYKKRIAFLEKKTNS